MLYFVKHLETTDLNLGLLFKPMSIEMMRIGYVEDELSKSDNEDNPLYYYKTYGKNVNSELLKTIPEISENMVLRIHEFLRTSRITPPKLQFYTDGCWNEWYVYEDSIIKFFEKFDTEDKLNEIIPEFNGKTLDSDYKGRIEELYMDFHRSQDASNERMGDAILELLKASKLSFDEVFKRICYYLASDESPLTSQDKLNITMYIPEIFMLFFVSLDLYGTIMNDNFVFDKLLEDYKFETDIEKYGEDEDDY